MSSEQQAWGSPADDESVDFLVQLAKIDWVDIDMVWVEVARRIGYDAPQAEFADLLAELVGVLIDHDVIPGRLGADPDFQPWTGSRAERVARVREEALALGRRPLPNDIAGLSYVPG